MSAHRVPLLRASLRRNSDPAASRDPQVRALVDQLSHLPIAPTPDPTFRRELRAQLVAITPRMVAEGAEHVAREAATAKREVATARAPRRADDSGEDGPHRPGRARAGHKARALHLGRGLKIATATLTVLVLLLGGAVWLSRSALPGDSLYGLKRASENVELSLASSDTARADDYLRFAQTRTAEVRALLAHSTTSALGAGPSASGAVDARTTQLIEQTLQSSDSDVRSAAGLLGRAALAQHSDSPLQAMTSWAPSQLARLTAIWTAMPLGGLRTHAAESKALVTAAQHRATALHSLVRCACMSGATSDRLGPVPCKVCSSTPAGSPSIQPGGTPGSRTGSTGQHNAPGSTVPSLPTTAGRPKSGATSGHSAGGTASGGTGASPTLPVSKLPTLPLPKVSKPAAPKASVGSCGISVSVIGIDVAVDACPTPHK